MGDLTIATLASRRVDADPVFAGSSVSSWERGGTHRLEETLAEDAVFRPPSFEGFRIVLAELWTIPEGS